MNVYEALRKNNYYPFPSRSFLGSQQARKRNAYPLPMTKTMTMTENIDRALDIVEQDYSIQDYDKRHATPPPPTLSRERSASPRSVSEVFTASADFFGKDCPMYSVDPEEEEEDDESIAVDPLPLNSSASADLRYMMQDCFGYDIIKEYLPKTKLTFHQSNGIESDDDDEDMETASKDPQVRKNLPRRRLLPEFKVLAEEEENFPEHVLSSEAAAAATPPSLNSSETLTFPEPLVKIEDPGEVPDQDHTAKNTKAPRGRGKRGQKKTALKKKVTIKRKKQTAMVSNKIKHAAQRKKPTKKEVEEFCEHVNHRRNDNFTDRFNKDTDENTIKGKETAPRIVEDTWNTNYMELVKFYMENGHSNVLRSDPNQKLSGWVKRQRNNLKDGKLLPTQIHRLEQLDFIWNRVEGAWNVKYIQLKEFEEENGHCHIPTKYDRSLAEWSQRQRREYRTQASTMTFDRIQKLESLPNWTWYRGKDTTEETE